MLKKNGKKLGVGSQILSLKKIEGTVDSRHVLSLGDSGTYFNATTDFEEIVIGKKGTNIKPRKIARCSYFHSKLVVALHKDVKINTFSQEFQSNYEHGKKVIYEALDDIDYINEFDLDMPIFEIVSKENGLIKSIKIDNLAKDIQDLILSVILQVIVRTLEKTDPRFFKFLNESGHKNVMIEHKNGDDNNKSLEEDIDKDEQKSVDEVNINNNNAPKSIKYNLMKSPGIWGTSE